MNIEFLRECLNETISAYKKSKNNLLWLEQYRLENQNYRDYEGREILELLQNADDAQSDCVDICLDSQRHVLTIKNYGDNTLAFTDEGMRSIMASYLSPKKNEDAGKGKLIGAKGLGFKSILNWTSEVTIHSANATVRFGEDVVRRLWGELRQSIASPQEYEKEAQKDGHAVPLPILRIPEIEERTEYDSKSTVIELTYKPHIAEAKIKKALTDFSAESLLFLHNLRHIKIDIDGDTRQYALQVAATKDGIETCRINGCTWLVAREAGEAEGRCYEVAAAFNLSGDRPNGYRLYTFFPTDEVFPFPCILHATLELNASRKAILSGERVNSEMMSRLAGRMIALADAVKEKVHGWDAYAIVNGLSQNGNFEGYAKELKDILLECTAGKEYIPLISATEYANANDCYYYSDRLFDFVKNHGGAQIFPKMALSGAPSGFRYHDDSEAQTHIDTFAEQHTDYSALAQFIKIVYDHYRYTGKKAAFHLFKDSEGCIIQGTAYLNTGRTIEGIPAFFNIKYVNDALKSALLAALGKSGSELERVRAIATDLSDYVANVSASDISGIKRMLILSRSDFGKYTDPQIHEVIACLFELYKSEPYEFRNSKTECYLPTEGGGGRLAKELVFGDARFPDGVKRLNLSKEIYEGTDYVAYPSFLKVEAQEIQDFYAELGVYKYFRTESVCYGDDKDYLRANGIREDEIKNASSGQVGPDVNRADVPANLDKWGELSLNDLIRLICKSGLSANIIKPLDIRWKFGRKWLGPEPLKINFLAYLLRKNTAAKALSSYVISTKEWVAGKVDGFKYDDKDELVLLILKRLGAKSSYADFSPQELYGLINAKADECLQTRDYHGVKEFYHRIKMAFVSMGNAPTLPEGTSLSMLCKKNGEDVFMDSREIFYSNNWSSEKLQSQLPILALQLRDGEDEVSKYFGCRRLKDLAVTLTDRIENQVLSTELDALLQKCKPYLLALASKDSGDGKSYDKDKKTQIERISIQVLKSASYSFVHNDIHTEPDTLDDGELIIAGKKPYLCCKAHSIADALSDPKFCNSVAEAICVALNLSSRENNDRFYRIIKSSDRELDFLRDSFDPDLWQSCQEAFGISDREMEFWKSVFEANDKEHLFDSEKIKANKINFLKTHLGIEADRTNYDGFLMHHFQQLRQERLKYVADYKIWLHQRLLQSPDLQRQYLGHISEFQSDEWVDAALDASQVLLIAPDYHNAVLRLIKEKFDFDPATFVRGSAIVPQKLVHYDYTGLQLSIEDESLLYFYGYEDYFKALKDKYIASADANMPSESEAAAKDVQPEIISDFDMVKPGGEATEGKPGNKRGPGRTRRLISDEELKEIGNAAEDAVLKALLKEDSGYEVGAIYSKHLNPETGNDAQGYDLEYRRKGKSLYRCLEIKHYAGNQIMVSRHEYEVAHRKEYKNRYDVALVKGHKIFIWENAFADESKYKISTDDYTISFKIK